MPLAVSLDSSTWTALALVLTIIGAALSWVAWRRRGLAAGLRGLAWTLLPVAAWLTGTLKLAVEIAEAVGSWATRLVFSPAVWAGIILAAGSVGLFLLSGVMRSRGIGVRSRSTEPKGAVQATPAPRTKTAPRTKNSDDLDDMADIEAILKKHGI